MYILICKGIKNHIRRYMGQNQIVLQLGVEEAGSPKSKMNIAKTFKSNVMEVISV